MKLKTLLLLAILGLFFLLPKFVHGQSGNYLTAGDFQIDKIIPPPPGNYSTQTADEIKAILQLQKDKTVSQVGAVREQDTLTPYLLCGTVVPQINAQSPRAIDLLIKVKADVMVIAEQGKQIWDRPRPGRLDKRIEKLVDLPPDSSYPGTNATVAYAWAAVLAELVPDRKEEIVAKADEIARNRVLAGAQYPSDVAAARILGEAIATKLLANEAFQRELAGVRRELAAHHGAGGDSIAAPGLVSSPLAVVIP